MTWEPGCREVPATDPPDYQPGDDEGWQEAATDYAYNMCVNPAFRACPACGGPIGTCANCGTTHKRERTYGSLPPLTDAEQDEAEARWETYYQPTEGDRGGPDGD